MATRYGHENKDPQDLYQLTGRDCLNVKAQTHPNPVYITDNASAWHYNATAVISYSFGGMHENV